MLQFPHATSCLTSGVAAVDSFSSGWDFTRVGIAAPSYLAPDSKDGFLLRWGPLRAGPVSPPQTGVGFPGGVLTLTPQLWWAPLDPLPTTCFPTQQKSEVGGHRCLDAILGPPSGEMLGSGSHPQSSLRSPPTIRRLRPPSLYSLPALQPIFPSNIPAQGRSWAYVGPRPSPSSSCR